MKLWALVVLFSVAGMGSLAMERSTSASIALFTLGSLLALGATARDAWQSGKAHAEWESLRAATEHLRALEAKVEVLEKRHALERM